MKDNLARFHTPTITQIIEMIQKEFNPVTKVCQSMKKLIGSGML